MERHAERLVVRRVHVSGFELVERGRELVAQSGASELGRPRQGAVSGVELLPLPRHRAVEQCAFLVVAEVVEHLDVVAADPPLSGQLSGAGRRGQWFGVLGEPGAGSLDECFEIHLPTTLHNYHDESNLVRQPFDRNSS